MTKYVINQFHFHGNYYAGDHIDIHDNTSVNLYQGEYSKETTAHETCVEDIQPLSSSGAPDFSSEIPDSIIFTKKAHQEHKIPTIVQALQKSIIGRKDKTRALVQELQSWQNDGYVDAHYNARVMYDELNKITPLSFEYDTFRKYYNNLI